VARPSVDVVVPFRGGPAELRELVASLERLRLRPGDSVLVVDNTPGSGSAEEPGAVAIVHAAELQTPGFARNRGAERGSADWLAFFDADTVPSPELLDRYFEPPPGERTALIAGGVRDEVVPADGRAVPRYAHIRGLMGQENSFQFGDWSFPQMANAACRRTAFESVGGFREHIRAAEDADLTYRLRAAGWEVERREAASVVHRSRQTVRGFVAQKLCHGAGAAWLHRHYPGSIPPRRRPGLVWWGLRTAARGLVRAVRSRDRDTALWAVFEPLEHLSYEFGRSLPNERRRPR
jgi:GT2 family glycosyltransferase